MLQSGWESNESLGQLFTAVNKSQSLAHGAASGVYTGFAVGLFLLEPQALHISEATWICEDVTQFNGT